MNENEYALSKLEKAYTRLSEAAKMANEELERDGTIQRFEFTFELLWKTIKIILNNNGIKAQTPRDCLKEAFRLEWLKDEKVFLDMMEDRNKTSHVYDESTSAQIFNNIKNNYVAAIAGVVKKLKTIL